MTSIKWNGREIQSPILRAFAVTFAVVVGGLLGAFGIFFAVCFVTILTPVHPLFRLFGRKGFYRGHGKFIADHTSFERC